MQLIRNRRLLRNNCCFFVLTLFLFEIFYLKYTKNPDTNKFNSDEKQRISSANVKIEFKSSPFDYLRPRSHPVSCQSLYESDPDELKHAISLLDEKNQLLTIPDEYYNVSRDQCTFYRQTRFNEHFHREDIEANKKFPLAFSILMYNNVEQFERLLRLIYRPQNFYCVHIDKDASDVIHKAVQSIVQCFDNVFMVNKQEKVLYATFSRLQADLNCMEDLFKFPSWKYLLNMANTELPLKTNSELVKILSIYRGYNDIEGRWKSKNVHRTEFVWQISEKKKSADVQVPAIVKTDQKKSPPPGNVEIVKGSAYGAFSRPFIEFVLTNPVARELLDWSRDTYSPDEHYWATLNFNTHLRTPGGHKARSDPTNWTARFVNWGEQNCYGRIVRGICVFGTVDLPTLINRHELVANKFHVDADPIVYQCLEEYILNKSNVELPLHDATFYRQMPFLLPS